MTIKASDITSLIEIFASSGWEELHVELDGLHLYLSRNPLAHSPLNRVAVGSAPPAHAAPAPTAQAPAAIPAAASAAPQANPPSPATPAADVPAHWTAVKAPNLGTFYRSPKPGAAPFVSEGESVSADTEVCLLEVMKLFTSVKAGSAGVVRRICVKDSEMVEHDQVLMYIEPV
jgi:acetyl-CoA carboxylase biotin carboxyl carrier protein